MIHFTYDVQVHLVADPIDTKYSVSTKWDELVPMPLAGIDTTCTRGKVYSKGNLFYVSVGCANIAVQVACYRDRPDADSAMVTVNGPDGHYAVITMMCETTVDKTAPVKL